MNFATWSIRNPIPVVVLFALLTIAGVWSFDRLPIQDMPDIDSPTVKLSLTQPGVTPAQLETEVARPVENAIALLEGLQHISTTITEGRVALEAKFVLGKPLFEALSEVKEAIDGIRTTLPKDLEEPAISADKVFGDPLLTYAVKSSKLDEEALSWFLDDTVAKRISHVPGVGRIERVGGVDREINVALDPEVTLSLGATPMIVSRALKATQQQLSGGSGKLGATDQSVRVVALAPNAESLARTAIPLPNGGYVALGDLGRVEDGFRERDQLALLDGQPVVGLRIYPARGADATKMSTSVDAALNSLVAETPGLQTTLVSSTVDQIMAQYRGSMDMLYEGAALAMLVVLLFLRDWRATLVAAISLPLSIVPVFIGMALLGFSLNTLSLLAIAVTVGVLVDDVIVEVENIKRHQATGKPARQATADAVVEIAIVVLATTLCLVFAFLPTTIMPGIPGLLFKQFGWTAIVAVLCSLLVARTLTPMLAAWILKPSNVHGQENEGGIMRPYLRVVGWCLSHRMLTSIAAALFFAASCLLLPFIPVGLLPADDVGRTTVGIEMAPGTTLETTQAKAEETRRSLATIDGVSHVFTTIGTRDAGGGNTAELLLILSEEETRPAQAIVEGRVRAVLSDVPGARFSVGSGGLGQRVELMLAGEDPKALARSAQAISREMRGISGLSSVRSSVSLERNEIVIRPDSMLAAERGIATEDVGDTVRIATDGDFDSDLGRLNLGSRQILVRVRFSSANRADVGAMENLRILGTKGLVPLSSIAGISVESGLTKIERFDRQRYVVISGDLSDTAFGTAMDAVMALPSVMALPTGVVVIEAGDNEVAGDLASGFLTAIVAGIACVYGVLVVLFKDFFQPITILSSIPFSLGGALALLLIGGSEINVLSLIGMVMLIGIVTKNSILLVEYAIVGMRDGGLTMHQALVDACRKRARPIIMTSIAMIAGMAPVAAGFGSDASRQPMALAVIGGLITSTALSLVIVPVVFSCVASAKRILAVAINPLQSSSA